MNVSIIIPTLCEAARVARAVDKAWQSGAGEVIVVDGGSRDGTLRIVADCRCRLLESPTGRAIQQNAGARAAVGDVLLFLHADTWLEAGAVAQIKTALAERRVMGGAFHQRIEADGRLFRLLEWGNSRRVRWARFPYGDQGIFLRREAFDQLGGFPEVRLMEDVLLARKFRRRWRPVLLPGPLHVSPRHWRRLGVVRQTLRNWCFLTALGLGASPDRLARYYRRDSDDDVAEKENKGP